MKFYHGTSSKAGIDTGDYIDPSFGQFECAVYATSKLDVARRWASARVAVAGGDPVVFEIVIEDDAVIETVDSLESCGGNYSDFDGKDAIIETCGEDGATVFVVLTKWAARFGSIA